MVILQFYSLCIFIIYSRYHYTKIKQIPREEVLNRRGRNLQQKQAPLPRPLAVRG